METENPIRQAAIEDLVAGEDFETGRDTLSTLNYLGYDHEESPLVSYVKPCAKAAIAALRRKDRNPLDLTVASPLETSPC